MQSSTISVQYRNLFLRRVFLLTGLLLALFVLFCIDLAVGPSMLSVTDVLKAIFSADTVDLSTRVIVWEVRLPYAIMAVLVGGALSLAGCEMQTIMNNPMASPFTLGVSAAAAFGAALAIILGVSLPGVSENWTIAANSFVFAFGSAMLLQSLSRLRNNGAEVLVLFGIALVFTFNALVGLLQYMASAEALQQFVFWSMGSLAKANWDTIITLLVVLLIVCPFSFAASWQLTALRLGEDSAKSYGVAVGRLRFLSLIRVSLLTATSVAFVGIIGFVGLVGPHIAKLLIGEDHRFSLPASILSGALVMTLASIASKAVIPGTIMPVGIMTSLIGVPVFIALIFGRKKR